MKISNRIHCVLGVMLAGAACGHALAEAPAATIKLARVEGNVMVNQGMNYTKAKSGTALRAGTKVITAKGASAAVLYQDGCIKQLKENSILTVGPATECAAGKTSERVYLAEAIGDTMTDAPPVEAGSMGAGGVVAGGGGISTGMIVGGLVIAGGAIASSGHNSDRFASAE